MAFCPNCGASATGRFCPNCGADVSLGSAPGASGAAPGFVPPSAAPGYVPPSQVAAPGLTENVASALCYVLGFITGIIFLVLTPYNQNRLIRFHAWQSIFLWVAIVAIDIAMSMVMTLLHLWLILPFILTLFHLAVFLGWLYLMYVTYNGKKIVLPVVGPLAQKQA